MEIKSGDEASFRLVYSQFFPVVMRVACHLTGNTETAEEICQEAFIRFFDRNITFECEDDAKYWLVRVAGNLALNSIRKRNREKATLDKLKHSKGGHIDSFDAADSLIREEGVDSVRKAISCLPDKLRTVLVLKEFGNLNYRQISKMLLISESNVKVRVFRARKELENILGREDFHVS